LNFLIKIKNRNTDIINKKFWYSVWSILPNTIKLISAFQKTKSYLLLRQTLAPSQTIATISIAVELMSETHLRHRKPTKSQPRFQNHNRSSETHSSSFGKTHTLASEKTHRDLKLVTKLIHLKQVGSLKNTHRKV
jgi:hypothetical protein